MVQGKPTSFAEHIITVLFIIPVGNEGTYIAMTRQQKGLGYFAAAPNKLWELHRI